MDIKEFVDSTVKKLDSKNLERLKEKLIGEHLKFIFFDEDMITQDVFCEKLVDYFEKIEIKTGDEFAKILTKYLANLDEIVKRYIPKTPSAKKGEIVPPMPRSIKYYKHAVELKGSQNLTMKHVADYSRIMMSLYMGAINAEMKETMNYEFSTEALDIDKIITAMKTEKAGFGIPIGKKTLFTLEEKYSYDAATFVITAIMFSYIKNKEVEGEY